MTDKIKVAFLTATWFGAGNSPKAPGTCGSLAALPFAFVISAIFGPSCLFLAAVAAYFAGVWASEIVMKEVGEHDPGLIVIDEVAGQWLTLIVAPLNLWAYLLGFAFFRLFDILKPPPIGQIDMEMRNATGVMLDDIMAGFYALICLYVVTRIFSGAFEGFI